MFNKKHRLIIITMIILLIILTGCQSPSQEVPQDQNNNQEENQPADEQLAEEVEVFASLFPEIVHDVTENTVTFVGGEEILTVTRSPQRVVVLQNSILDLWYLAGGEAIARVDGTTNVPDEAMDLPTVGSTSGFSLEAVIAMEPDLVIMSTAFSSHREIIPALIENNIEFVPITANMGPYEGFHRNLYLFSKILDRDDIFETRIHEITEEVAGLIEKVAVIGEKPSVAILFTSSRNVQLELNNSLAGEIAYMLDYENIASETGAEGANKVAFSMERLLELDPDFILVTTMGDLEQCEERLEQDVKSHEAWATLTAVQEDRIHFLPSDLFMFRPNARYPEAFEYLARIVTPEVFNLD